MLHWIRDAYTRHKKKIVTLGLFSTGAFAIYKYVSWKFSKWRELEIEEYKTQARKQFHYESTQQTCKQTFMHLLPPLRNKVFVLLNAEEITDALSKNPENKLELWEELKLIAFTRTLTSIIATCTLFMFLQVQMNIIGGYMYLENIDASDDTAEISELINELEMDKPISSLQKEYLNNVQFLFEDGILKLVDDVRKAVNEIVKPLSLKSKMNHLDVSQLMFSILDHFMISGVHEQFSTGMGATATNTFSKYILNNEQCKKKTIYFDEQKYQQILSETFDIIENEDFQTVLMECIKECLDHTMHAMGQSVLIKHSNKKTGSDVHIDEIEQKMPLAKLIPIVTRQSSHIFKAGENEFLKTLFAVESIGSFSANIYESFSLE